jgi:aminoglycoside 6'-N-acetyltransferase
LVPGCYGFGFAKGLACASVRRFGTEVLAGMSSDSYSFAKLTGHDLELLHRWLSTPDARRWWGEPDRELAEIRKELADPRIDMYLVSHGRQKFAFIQDYDANAWPQPQRLGLPAGSRCIDVLIGVPAMLGRGHGSALLRRHVQDLLDRGTPLVAIDPLQANVRACKAYRKAGFVDAGLFESPDGPVQLMLCPQTVAGSAK